MRSIVVRTMVLVVALLLTSAEACKKKARARVGLGYDRGLSLRIQTPGKWQFGLIVGGGGGNTGLYSSRWDEVSGVVDDTGSYARSSTDTRLGLLGSAHIGYRIKRKSFTLTPYLRAGYGYSKSYGNRSDDSYSGSRKERTHEGVGEIGLMPGFRYKRISLEVRLGAGGRIRYNDFPRNYYVNPYGSSHSDSRKSVSRDVFLVYPHDIIQSLILHIRL